MESMGRFISDIEDGHSQVSGTEHFLPAAEQRKQEDQRREDPQHQPDVFNDPGDRDKGKDKIHR